MPNASRSFSGFAVISGCGWLLDVGITMGLVYAGLAPFWASFVGAATAVTFVYFVSIRSIFEVGGRLGARGFPFYVIWQVCAIAAASALVAFLAGWLAPLTEVALDRLGVGSDASPLTWASGIAKALVTPLTLLANFLFMRWLTIRLQSTQ